MPAPVITVKATSDSVETGGALYDVCGNVMGINLLVDNGNQFAFAIDVAADGLQKLGIQAAVADSACSMGASRDNPDTNKSEPSPADKEKQKEKDKQKETTASSWRWPQGGEWVGVAIIVGLIGLALRRGTTRPVAPVGVSTAIPEPPPYVPPVVAKPAKPSLRGLGGQYSGTSIPIENATVLGRDPHTANVVFTSEADSISKRHCSIRWDTSRSFFVLEDLGSTNGTFLASGERLAPGQPRDLKAGSRFYLGDQKNQFELTLE